MRADRQTPSAVGAGQPLQACQQLVRELEARLEECEDTLGAIRRGEIDAVVISDTATAHRVYTLENADRPYRMLIEQIQEGAVTLSADGTVFYCNQRLAEMLGLPQEQVIGHRLQPFLRADDVGAFEQLLDTAHFKGHQRQPVDGKHGGLDPPNHWPVHQRGSSRAIGLWNTLADPNQLENALLNLCINARDAMPRGGRLTIETANRWLDEPAARNRDMPPGQYVSLCVSDTGTGMTPEVIRRAVDPFFTTKPEGQGTGLGLSMIHGFAKQSGGQVRIYSELGQGSTVCIYLPRHRGDAESEAEPTGLQQPLRTGTGETVLVVDDEATVRMLISEVLAEMGLGTIEAADGPTALKVLKSDTRVDLLITDIGLPGGMNGRQMVDAAHKFRPNLKVLFITGYAENAVIGNGILEPDMHLVTKPFALEHLANRVRDIMAGTNGSASWYA